MDVSIIKPTGNRYVNTIKRIISNSSIVQKIKHIPPKTVAVASIFVILGAIFPILSGKMGINNNSQNFMPFQFKHPSQPQSSVFKQFNLLA